MCAGTEIEACLALGFTGRNLKRAKLYGTALLRLGGNGEISGTVDYALPQAWASALAGHPATIDGFIDMSRRVNDAYTVVLIERNVKQALAMHVAQQIALFDHVDFLATKATPGITVT